VIDAVIVTESDPIFANVNFLEFVVAPLVKVAVPAVTANVTVPVSPVKTAVNVISGVFVYVPPDTPNPG
jgi:hypothetical protein